MVKALVVVAHPDDETIWMGGRIMHEKGWEWTILSLCRKDDTDRKPKFFKACSELGARGFISDLDDEHPEQDLHSLDEVVKRVEPIVADKQFDFVFTHGPNGEYGHKRHIETHNAVKEMVEGGEITCANFLCFDYIAKNEPFRAEPNPKSFGKFALSPQEFARKKYLIEDVYGFSKDSFESISCTKNEHFWKVL
ncbi:MAG TPA: hypothetical protein HA254_00420 [Candidatus Diapherotrites archaeon]|uniref:PIG-L family deacetylase n=1 Tax=Candidatus Iainarchaeum sp. TaxID=3101447 RepID=A0A7J4IWE1_9ARCH|nr:hypothetical protein [Candidatus Diapherotrites archaeon]